MLSRMKKINLIIQKIITEYKEIYYGDRNKK